MLRVLLVLFTFSLLSSCGIWGDDEVNRHCPKARIARENAYLVKKGLKSEEFQIELVGFEGYCYYDNRIKHDKAVVTPVFKIKRLSPSDETDVMFSFYLETVKGPPEYLGKKTYHAKANIPLDKKEITFKGQEGEARIPPEMKYEFDINLGLALSKDDIKYNRRTFDIPLEYEEN